MSLATEIIDGEICAACMMPFTKPNGFPCVCLECHEDGWKNYTKSNYPIDNGENTYGIPS